MKALEGLKRFAAGAVRIVTGFSRKHGMYHCWPMIFYMGIYLLWFAVIESIPRSFYLQILLRIDRFIPLIEIFVLPYVSWFFFVVLQMYTFYTRDREAYDEACTFLMIGMTVFLLISTVLPNRQPLRLVELPRDNVFTRMIASLWRTDTPTNVFPSIHVFNTLAVEIPLLRSNNPFFRRRSVRAFSAVWSLLIILSTMFVRQHSMFDVLTAQILALVCSYVIYGRKRVFRFEKWDRFAKKLEKKWARGNV